MAIDKGATVEVVSGRKVAPGTRGEVFWSGPGDYGPRVGFRDAQGVTHWVNEGDVRIVGSDAPAPASSSASAWASGGSAAPAPAAPAPAGATYAKLRDGSWGVRVTGPAAAGQSVTVRKKDGTSKVERIAAVVWEGDGVTLCSIEARERRGGCACTDGGSCCRPRCQCGAECNCRGGPIWNC